MIVFIQQLKGNYSDQMQLVTFFQEISLFDATWFDIAAHTKPHADSDERQLSLILPKTQESELKIMYTVFPCQSFIGTCQNLEGCAASRENRQKECIGVASVITFVCSDFTTPDCWSILVEGYFGRGVEGSILV